MRKPFPTGYRKGIVFCQLTSFALFALRIELRSGFERSAGITRGIVERLVHKPSSAPWRGANISSVNALRATVSLHYLALLPNAKTACLQYVFSSSTVYTGIGG